MPLPEPKAARQPLHHRNIQIRGYKRDDGLFDIEAHLVDTKSYDFNLAAGVRHAGEAVHGMWLRITIDRTLTIVDADAAMDATPYSGYCEKIAPDYRKLVGLAIRPGYLRQLKELFGGVRGCTHVSELAAALATAAFQTLAGQRAQDPARRPFQLDRCHALDATGPVVALHYPRWYQGTEPVDPAGHSEEH